MDADSGGADSLARVRNAFDPVPGYLNAATMGLPPRAAVQAIRDDVLAWQAGAAKATSYDDTVNASRAAYARLVGVPVSRVATGSQVSILAGLIAASLPDGSEVLTAVGEFTSILFPFLTQADRKITVRQVPLEALPGEIRPSTTLVSFSLVQSSDGRIAAASAIRDAARAVGARTLCDVTQAAGWLPVRAADVDVTVCGTYKWLCAPRGTAFLTIAEDYQDQVSAINAGWYAGESVWDSVYGPDMKLAPDARRFDTSPAWMAWVGTAVALQLFADADPLALLTHNTTLADAFRAGLQLPPAGTAIVSLPDLDGDVRLRLLDAGCTVAGRAGMVRLAFHVWNDESDVERALNVLRP